MTVLIIPSLGFQNDNYTLYSKTLIYRRVWEKENSRDKSGCTVYRGYNRLNHILTLSPLQMHCEERKWKIWLCS